MTSLLKLWVTIGFLIAIAFAVQAQPGTTMYINGRHLYSAVGEKVIFRGVNEMFIYSSDIQGTATLPQIAQTGANVVRICWHTNGSASDLDALLSNCIANKMIPIVQLDDITGNLGGMSTCLNYWIRADVKTAINKYKKWVLINIANEAGDNNTTDAQFQSTYISAISQLRAAGYTMPLVIDAYGYGQNENAILNNWNALQQNDPQHNLLFSLHPYWKDGNTAALQTRFTAVFNAVISNNIPFIIGEGPQQTGYDCSTSIPYSWVMQQCQTNQIGWLVWTWGKVQDGTGGCGTNFDVTTNGNYGSWSTAWGQAIAIGDANSIKNTAVRPPSILGTLPADRQAPTAPTTLTVVGTSSNGATLKWTASTDNVGVIGYTVYNGTAVLGTSVSTTLTLAGLVCNTNYSFTVKARDAAGNLSAASNTATGKTGICDTQAPTVPTALVASAVLPTNVGLSWTASTDNVGVTGYQIYRNGTLLQTQTGTTLSVTGLTCNTSYTFTVKATDAAGNLSAASNVLVAKTSTCPTGDIVYNDALNVNWQDWSWSAYRYFNTTTQKIEGSYSIQVDYGGFGGFALRRATAIAPTANTIIKFWAYSTGANSLEFTTQTDDSGTMSNAILLTTIANQWREFTVDMAALGNPTAIKRVNIKNNSGNNVTVYFDYIRFDTKLGDTSAPTAPTSVLATNISTNGLTLNWTASTDNVGVTGYQVYQGSTLLSSNVSGTTYAVAGLSCGTAYTFAVKAVDAAGNVSASSNTLSANTPACVGTTVMVYDEALNADWNDWSWSVTNNQSNTSPVKVGTKSIRSDMSGWGALSLRKVSTTTSTLTSTAIRFWVFSPTATTIWVYTSATDTGGDGTGYMFTTTPNVWTEQIITNGQLGNPMQIKRIQFKNYTANSITAYFDNIQLVSVSGARTGLDEPIDSQMTVFPNPSSGSVQVQYTSERAEAVQLQVIDMSGSVLQRQAERAEPGQNTFQVNLTTKQTGLYLIRLESSIGVLTQKVDLIR